MRCRPCGCATASVDCLSRPSGCHAPGSAGSNLTILGRFRALISLTCASVRIRAISHHPVNFSHLSRIRQLSSAARSSPHPAPSGVLPGERMAGHHATAALCRPLYPNDDLFMGKEPRAMPAIIQIAARRHRPVYPALALRTLRGSFRLGHDGGSLLGIGEGGGISGFSTVSNCGCSG